MSFYKLAKRKSINDYIEEYEPTFSDRMKSGIIGGGASLGASVGGAGAILHSIATGAVGTERAAKIQGAALIGGGLVGALAAATDNPFSRALARGSAAQAFNHPMVREYIGEASYRDFDKNASDASDDSGRRRSLLGRMGEYAGVGALAGAAFKPTHTFLNELGTDIQKRFERLPDNIKGFARTRKAVTDVLGERAGLVKNMFTGNRLKDTLKVTGLLGAGGAVTGALIGAATHGVSRLRDRLSEKKAEDSEQRGSGGRSFLGRLGEYGAVGAGTGLIAMPTGGFGFALASAYDELRDKGLKRGDAARKAFSLAKDFVFGKEGRGELGKATLHAAVGGLGAGALAAGAAHLGRKGIDKIREIRARRAAERGE